MTAPKVAREATDRASSKRLVPFPSEPVPVLEHHKQLQPSQLIRSQLVNVSASTNGRAVARSRQRGGHRRCSPTRSVSGLKALITVHTFSDRGGAKLVSVEVELAAHCGASMDGFYLNTGGGRHRYRLDGVCSCVG